MNVILGFGSTEQQFLKDEEAAALAKLEELFAASEPSYFDDRLIADFTAWLAERGASYRAEASRFKTADEHLDRYSEFWPTVIADASYVVVILKCLHINRRHPLSPDGWGSMGERAVFVFEALDIADALAAASEAA